MRSIYGCLNVCIYLFCVLCCMNNETRQANCDYNSSLTEPMLVQCSTIAPGVSPSLLRCYASHHCSGHSRRPCPVLVYEIDLMWCIMRQGAPPVRYVNFCGDYQSMMHVFFTYFKAILTLSVPISIFDIFMTTRGWKRQAPPPPTRQWHWLIPGFVRFIAMFRMSTCTSFVLQ